MLLVDQYSRVHDYLRISLTDRCNFRCTYCMPDGYQCSTTAPRMLAKEIIAIAADFKKMGVRKVRLTGGEPLVRADFADIVLGLSNLSLELALTTNGLLLDRFWDVLAEAELNAINISIDSLQPELFRQITGIDALQRVWRNIQTAVEKGFKIKLNAVMMKGINDHEITDFVQLTRRWPVHVRFIEMMPFSGNHWAPEQVITTQEMLAPLLHQFDVIKLCDEPHATAKKYKVIGHEGTFAFISTMSSHFCGDCNRLRLTADGKLKNCLFSQAEVDILTAHRNGTNILPLVEAAVNAKAKALGGQLLTNYNEIDPEKIRNRQMVAIGG